METTVRQVASYLDEVLDVRGYQDMAINGLQVESPEARVTKIGFAVDSGLSVLERATQKGCQLLVVHHGALWGKCEPVTGAWGKKVSMMMRQGLSLYAAHLPLDGHLELGNAARLAAVMGLTEVVGAFEYKGRTIGVRGKYATSIPLAEVLQRFNGLEGVTAPLVLPFGKREVMHVAIITGSGSAYLAEAAEVGIDLLVTGEPKQEIYHAAKDLGQSAVCIGHYASETFGVRALERVLSETFRVETEWISEPTGI